MPRFVNNAAWTHHFNANLIVSIGNGRRRESGFGFVHTAKLKDGGEIILDGNAAYELTNPVIAVIPATEGYSTIEMGECPDGSPYEFRQPVIAWQLKQAGEMVPVTIRGPNNGNTEDAAVEQPTGEVWDPSEDAIYDSAAIFREASLKKVADRDAERRAQKVHANSEEKA